MDGSCSINDFTKGLHKTVNLASGNRRLMAPNTWADAAISPISSQRTTNIERTFLGFCLNQNRSTNTLAIYSNCSLLGIFKRMDK